MTGAPKVALSDWSAKSGAESLDELAICSHPSSSPHFRLPLVHFRLPLVRIRFPPVRIRPSFNLKSVAIQLIWMADVGQYEFDVRAGSFILRLNLLFRPDLLDRAEFDVQLDLRRVAGTQAHR